MSDAPEVTPKRFIAGAVCPACSAQDTIKMWNVDGTPHRECVSCGFTDTLDAQGNSVPSELPTRVARPAEQKVPDGRIKAVQFFPNPKLKKPE
jgi:uncharacterized metal-binding protein (TIGR02443 family)